MAGSRAGFRARARASRSGRHVTILRLIPPPQTGLARRFRFEHPTGVLHRREPVCVRGRHITAARVRIRIRIRIRVKVRVRPRVGAACRDWFLLFGREQSPHNPHLGTQKAAIPAQVSTIPAQVSPIQYVRPRAIRPAAAIRPRRGQHDARIKLRDPGDTRACRLRLR
jgi:hypothetical protein